MIANTASVDHERTASPEVVSEAWRAEQARYDARVKAERSDPECRARIHALIAAVKPSFAAPVERPLAAPVERRVAVCC
ncbi:hypothetical protein [Cutibacterium sp.]|uniref:hypothetical protein n=1 Tax=Cutibacterium sp. TaxID=1912221 RepID=UPI0026DC8302|nr:hypothetical protein [Cutibacterium sp.]MDO4411986.1 hypothetical protein [Cutibacterium sp.]